MTAVTPGQAAREELLAAQRSRGDLTWSTPWDELPGDYRRDWERIAQAAIDAQEQRAAAALGIPQRSDAETAAMLRADLADAEAQLARWPRCPSGCSCRMGVEGDADANECGCDGPCNGGPQPELAEVAGALREALGDDPDAEPGKGETPGEHAVRLAHYLKERVDELHGLIAGQEPQPACETRTCAREFAGWFAGEGYPSPDDRYDGDEMEAAFAAGMEAQRDLAMTLEPCAAGGDPGGARRTAAIYLAAGMPSARRREIEQVYGGAR